MPKYTTVNGETVEQEKIDTFLKELRDSGKINMFGAAPYVAEAFNLDIKDARLAVAHWMENFKG